jgi:GAF domain-containing protein
MKRRSKVGVSLAKTLRLKGAKAKRLAPGSISPSADETGAIARLTRERDEALEQQAATSQVLQLISSSPGDLQAIFSSILENAVRICDASFGDIGLWKDGTIRLVAIHKTTPPAFAEQRKRTQNVPPAANSPIARMLATKTPVHIPDLQHDRAYLERSSPVTIAVVELGGVRTFLGVPMLKGNEVVGMLFLSRQFVQPFTDKQIELVKNFAAQAVIAIENARLLNELRKRTTDLGETLEQQTATTDVLRVISTSRGETAPVFQTMLQSAVQLCHAKFGAMYYCEGSAFRTVAIHNAPPAFQAARLNTLVHPNPLSGLGRVVETKQFVQIEDMAAEPAYAVRDAMRVAAVELGGVRSLLCVPMIKESAVVGAITIYRDVVGQFTEKQIELVKNFASQAVIAIENARLLNELRQRTEDLSQRTTSLTEALEQQTATSEVLRVISSSQGELQPVFESILANATSVCQAQFGHLLLCEGDAFRNVAMCDVPIALVEKVRGQLFRPHSESPLAQAAITKEPVQVHDLMVSRPYLDGHPAIVAQVELGGTRTLVAVPMLGGSGLVGVIILYRNKVHPFTDKQIDLVKNFAAQAVIAIENARLLNELRLRTTDLTEALEQQTATSDVLQVISGSPDNLQPVFAAMLERAVRICDAKFGTLYLAEGGKLRLVAAQQAPEFVEARTAAFEPALGGAFYETMRTKQVVHVPDLAVTKLYAEREPTAVAAVELGGVRTAMAVPMLKDDKVIGIITIVRQEVRLFADKQIALVTNFAAQAVIAIENARLLNELRQSLAQQTATADVLRVISSSPGDLEPVFSTMLENAVRICDANFGNIYRWDSDALHLVATCNTPPAFADARRFSFSNRPGPKTVTGRMLASKDLVHVVDTTTEPGYGDESDPGAVAAVELGGARTILAVPMRKEDELIGSFTVYRQEVRPFTDKQIELVKNFAAQAVIAIENARLLNELRQRTTDLSESLEQQTATSEVLQVISSSASDLRPVFASMVENGIRLCSANFGALTLLEGDAYRIGAMHNMPSGFAERWQGLMIRPGPLAPLVRAATSKDCVHIGDLSQDAAYIERDPNVVALVDGGHVRTILVVPMLKEQKFVGALSIYRQEKRPFTTKQIELIKNFASQAVIAIENARLLNELKQSLEQQTATSEVLGVISRSKFDLQPILQSVVDTALRLCRADAASIFRLDGGFYRWAVGLNDDPAYREIEQQTPIPPGQGTLVGRVALSRKVARSTMPGRTHCTKKKATPKLVGFIR